jgi:hypothetical protein
MKMEAKEILEEVETVRMVIESLHGLPHLLDKYDEAVYRLVNLAVKAKMPKCVTPEELHDPRRVSLTTEIVNEMVSRLRKNVEYEEGSKRFTARLA